MTILPPPADLDGAVRTLLARRTGALAAGATAVGWKVGLDAPALQEHFGLRGPVVGYLTDATELEAGQPVAVGGWHQPLLEVELALRIGPDGGLAAVAPAIELVDIDLPFDRIGPIVEGNIFHRGVLFGADVAGADVADLTVTVTRAGQVVATGGPPGDPAARVAAVRSFLAEHGAALEPGQRIIAGSLTPPLAVAPGDRLTVAYGSLGSLEIACTT